METVRRGACFLAIGLILMGSLAMLSNVAPVYPEMHARRSMIREHGRSIEVLSFGASHAGAVDFEETGFRGFHLWNPGSDLYETSFLIAEMLPQTPHVRCILVALSPLQIDADNGAPVARDRRARRRELYAHTWSPRWIRGDLGSFVAGKLSIVARDDHWKRVWLALLGRRETVPVRSDGDLVTDDEPMPEELFADHGAARASMHRAARDSVRAVRPHSGAEGRRRLQRVIEGAADHGIGVILYTPPYHRSYLSALEAGELDDVRQFGARLAGIYTNVQYGDFTEHSAFIDSAVLFRNSDHLNAAGGRSFSRNLLRPMMETCRR